MLRVTVDIDVPAEQCQDAKEVVAMALERLGVCRVVKVEVVEKQTQMKGF